MNPDVSPVPYLSLVALADHLFEECEDDVKCLSDRIDTLDSALRNELLVSDLLNAYQVFYYFFRILTDDLLCERLELEPASSLTRGVKIDEVELLDLVFSVKDHEPVITVSDGERPLIRLREKRPILKG